MSISRFEVPAKYPGYCPQCEQPIEVGQLISPSSNDNPRFVHSDCEGLPSASQGSPKVYNTKTCSSCFSPMGLTETGDICEACS